MKLTATVLALVLGLAPVAGAGPLAARPAAVPRVSMPAVLPGSAVLPSNGLSLSAPSLSPSALASSLSTDIGAMPIAVGALPALPAAAAAPLMPAAAAAPRAALSPLAALSSAANEAPKTPEEGEGAEAQPASPEQQGAQAGQAFDGSAAKAAAGEPGAVDTSAPAPEGLLARFGIRRELQPVARRAAANDGRYRQRRGADEEDQLDELGLFYAGTSARGLLDSHIWGDVKLIKPTEGSKWWWNKFKAGESIRIKAGSEWLFQSTIVDAQTKPIGRLSKTDLSGIFSAADLGRHPVAELRRAVVERLTKAHKDQFQVTLNTPVRLIHFKTPKQLDGEAEQGKPRGERYDPFAERAPLKLPAGSPLRRLNQYFPKAVMVDLDAFGERIPPRLIEDMGKLQRAGVKFVFFSDRPGADHRAKQTQILDGLYGSLFVHDGGAQVVAHSRDQAHTRSADFLTAYDRGVLLAHAKMAVYENGGDSNGVAEVPVAAPGGLKAPARGYFKGRVPAGVDAEAFRGALQARLAAFGLRGEVELEPAGKAGSARGFIVRHRRMERSMGDVLRGLQSMGVYANPQEILVISEDPAYAGALGEATRALVAQDQAGAATRAGAVRSAIDAASSAGVALKGEELVENALGAVLGEYRQNKKNDFVTSASALESFSHYTDRFFAQELIKGEENLYAFWGHESHDVMNWVAWVQRNTGKAPTEEETVERFRRQWDEAVHSPEFAVYLPPGRDLINVREAAVGRLKGMYQVYRRVMDLPGAELVGTEIPNIFSLNRFDRKTGESRRVFIRTIFDFAVTVPSADGKGRKLLMMDFKSGVKPTEEVLRKKIQPRTYRLFTTYKWASLPEQYDTVSGELRPVTDVELEFIYNRSAVPIHLHGWNDSQTELEILRVAERMRQDKQRTHLRPTRKRRAPAAGAKKPAPKRAAKKPAADAE